MFAVLDWPSNLGLRPSGVETLPAALRRAGLVDGLHARDAGIVAQPAPYDSERSPETGLLNGPALREAIDTLATAVAGILQRDEIPVVLAGDCSVVLGGLLGTRRANRSGRVGLLFLDGHVDFDEPAQSPTGEAADMDLALATGRGPEILTRFDGQAPLVRDEDVAAVGARDRESWNGIETTPITLIDLEAVRERGAAAVADDALNVAAGPEVSRFWCHVDADVLDDALMPAVDYRQPGGLSPAELTTILGRAAATGRMAGLSIAIYNPKLDPEGEGARLLVEVVARALSAPSGAR